LIRELKLRLCFLVLLSDGGKGVQEKQTFDTILPAVADPIIVQTLFNKLSFLSPWVVHRCLHFT